MDVLLAPDQMVLQIHESIGHPLELDRILGDERNFAGTSFVTPDMFGTLPLRLRAPQHHVRPDAARGARELRVRRRRHAGGKDVPDPRRHPRASARRRDLAERARACRASPTRAPTSWNRPPIDRMANLNLEPGDATFDELVAGIERGVLIETNASWSIDDSRNKFQFGCERGQRHRERQARRTSSRTRTTAASAPSSGAALRASATPTTVQRARHAVLRQGRAVADDPRRPCVARLRVHERRRVRRRSMSAAARRERLTWRAISTMLAATARPRARRRRALHATWFAAEDDRLRADEPRQGPPAGHVSQRYLDIRLIRGARHAVALAVAVGRSAVRIARHRRTRSPACATRCRELADDPHLLLPTTVDVDAATHAARPLPPTEAIVDTCSTPPHGLDLVGISPRRDRCIAASRTRTASATGTSHDVQPAMEPLSPRRQGGEDRRTAASRGTTRRSPRRWTMRASSSR